MKNVLEVGDVDGFVRSSSRAGSSVPGWRALLAAEVYVTGQGSAHAKHGETKSPVGLFAM